MTNRKSTIAGQLGAAQLAINNTLNDAEIKALVAAYGYNDEMLAEGWRLFEAADAAANVQALAESAQLVASQAFAAAKAQAVDAYQALAKVARATLPPAELPGLQLNGAMPQGADAFRDAASRLFANAAKFNALAKFGYDASRLSAERAKLTACEAAGRRQDSAKGAAQQATQEHAAALTALNQWLAQYIKIARVALRAKPQLLEKIGVVARTSPTAAQRAARQKKTAPAM